MAEDWIEQCKQRRRGEGASDLKCSAAVQSGCACSLGSRSASGLKGCSTFSSMLCST